jgi:poly(3-hydroxybutyrate) depolymerase
MKRLLIFLLFFYSCSNQEEDLDDLKNPTWTQKEFTMNHEGLEREYILYKPKNFSENAPLMMMLHGYSSNNNNLLSYSKMNAIADQNGFMICYPQGAITYLTNQSHWNANLQMILIFFLI